MNSPAWFALVALGVTALTDHYAVARRDKRLEYVSKPVTLAWLVLFAVVVDGAPSELRMWWIAALALSLAGDVFLMLPVDRFVAGLASFLLAHLAYVAGFLTQPIADHRWLAAGAVVLVAGPLLARMLRGPGMKPPLRLPVTLYVIAIGAMVTLAWSSGSWVAGAGATLFMLSDALIGWRRFVIERPWMPLAIIVTYHLGQLGLALYLVST